MTTPIRPGIEQPQNPSVQVTSSENMQTQSNLFFWKPLFNRIYSRYNLCKSSDAKASDKWPTSYDVRSFSFEQV